MTRSEHGALALARVRALGTVLTGADRAALDAAAARAGRAFVELQPADAGGPRLGLGWVLGCEPTEDEALMPRRPNPGTLEITFAVALRSCWTDPLGHPYPGRPVARQRILDEVLLIQGHSPAAVAARSRREAGNVGGVWHARHALDRLVLSGYMEDQPQDQVRPGRLVALWSPAQAARARALWNLLAQRGSCDA